MRPQCGRRRTFVLPDPGGEYSLALLDRLFVLHGLRPVCVYADAAGRARAERLHPVLRGHLVETVLVGLDPTAVAAALRDRYDVVGVVPHQEEHVAFAGALCDALGVSWNSARTLAPFRDKLLLKQVLGSAGVRTPLHRPFLAASDAADPTLPERFVLKPVDGVGNRAVGVFSRGDVDAVARHLERHPTETWLLEEHIDGTEFSVNGQVRADGHMVLHGVVEYERTTVGDCPTVYSAEWVCSPTREHHDAIVAYAADVLAATGLRRSPFHLEVKVDTRGPCVIDLAARFGGAGLVHGLARSAPGAVDPFTLASHDYIGSHAPEHARSDATVAPTEQALFVYGVAREDCVIHQLEGCEEIEAHPAFVRWVAKPFLGQRLAPTQALYSAPYIVDLRAPAGDDARRALIDHVQRTIRWNVHPAPARQLVVTARHRARLVRDRARDLAAGARRAVR